MTKTKNKTGNVVPFMQNADFYARKGDERRQRGALIEAASFYRKAMNLEWDDPDFRTTLGCIYGEMGCTRLSNYMLASAIWRGGDGEANLYYQMGVNYFEQRMYDEAMTCFQEMMTCDGVENLNISPEISAFFAEADEAGEEDKVRTQCSKYTNEAMEALGEGEDEKAVELLEKAWALAPCSPEQACNLAMAYYCRKDYDRAMTVCNRAMLEDAGSLQLHCVLALLYRETDDDEAAQKEIDFLKQATFHETYEGMKVGMTLFDLDAVEEAAGVFERMRAERPFDVEVLHRLAICRYNLGEYEAAAECWKRTRAIDDKDEVFRFYEAENNKALAGKKHRKKFRTCAYDLPMESTLAYIAILQSMQKGNVKPEEVKDGERVLEWALRRDDRLRFAALSVLADSDPDGALDIAHTLLCDCSVDLEEKQMLIMLLLGLGERDATAVFLPTGMADLEISQFAEQMKLPVEYARVPELFSQKMTEKGASEALLTTGLGLWQHFTAAMTETEPVTIRESQIGAFAAAVAYIASNVVGENVTKKQMVELFETTISRFQRAEKLLYEYVLEPGLKAYREGKNDDENN